MNSLRNYAIGLTVCGASVATLLVGRTLIDNVRFASAAEKVEVTREQLSTVTDLSNVFKAVGKAVEPSVVQIQVKKTIKGAARGLPFDDDTLKRFFPDRDGDGQPDLPPGMGGEDGGDLEQVGTGSGVIMEAEDGSGYILTNNHVAGGATEMDITLSDGREIKNGKLLGADKKSDLAVVKIQADKLIPAKWGNSDELDRGDWVLAFGSPFGYVGSMTHGIVSALNRQAGILDQQQGYENFIQVDAPINPGNSGGPLVNLHGEVVGVNTAIASRSGGFQGIGFAIPSNQAHYVYNALKASGHVTRGWIGVSIRDVSKAPELAATFGYKGIDGVLVEQTFANTPADGKLQKGDIITKVDGKPVVDVQHLRNLVATTTPGKDMKLTVFRDGKEQDQSIKIGQQPEDLLAMGRGKGGPEQPSGGKGEAGIDSLGIRLATPTDEMLQKFNLTDVKEGAMVVSVQPRSPGFVAGLRQGDLITQVGSEDVKSADEASAAIGKGDLKKGIRLYVVNADSSRFVIVKSDEAK